ncbi:unnamed protein product [Notodromas monacha]|uniref:Pyridoxine 5'-phosphate synthase n=1 Tax=Notodromas monacha TaxID=399045 RepID=A0A7R9GL79_9CRUS|nr:unnamed protein product [Notodromas monacha]CAG0925618.1 unnamed protein product [Notodromas monacha]
MPNVLEAAIHCERYGAQGITVHPRPDERHITYQDVRDLKPLLTTEFNIEGNPQYPSFIDLVLEVQPHQVTLVPDADGALTSNAGWDCKTHADYLKDIVRTFKQANIRTSIFLDAVPSMVEYAAQTGADRIELYTEHYAHYHALHQKEQAISDYISTAQLAQSMGLGINAGHDLDTHNLGDLIAAIPFIDEVSIGHALISDALYDGLETTIQKYLKIIDNAHARIV